MSFMRLLVAGSSLRGIRDRRSPYKMTQQHLLPKFGAGKPTDTKGVVPAAAGPELAPVSAQNEEKPMNIAETEMLSAPEAAKARQPNPVQGWRFRNPFRA